MFRSVGFQATEASIIGYGTGMFGGGRGGHGLRFDSSMAGNPYHMDCVADVVIRSDNRHELLESLAQDHLRKQGLRQDAGLTAAFARQLEHIMVKVYEARYQKYRAREFFPVNSEVDPGALSFTYRMTERTGAAALINAGNAKDLPNADVAAFENQAPIVTLGASYNFSVINQLSGAMANIPIEAMKAAAARKNIEALEETIFCVGSPNAGVSGVTNVPGIVATTKVSSGGTWFNQYLSNAGTSAFTSTLVTSIASDINAMITQIISQSYGEFTPTDCLLPVNLWTLLKAVPQSTTFNSKSLLTFLEEMTGLHFDYWPALSTAGSSAGSPAKLAAVNSVTNPALSGRILVYDRDPEVMQLIQAQPFTQLAPQDVGLTWLVNTYSRIGGAMSPQPLGISYMDGCAESDSCYSIDAFYDGGTVSAVGSAWSRRDEFNSTGF
jgi:hypothetical protein